MAQDSKRSRVRVAADGTGLVSRAGVALLRELTVSTGLGTGWSEALLDTYDGMPVHLPGRVLADLAVMIADGGDALAHLATLRDQDKLFGPVASDATAWRVSDRVDDEHLARLQAVRASARERAWAAGAGPDLAGGLVIDIDATVTIAHSEKENAAKTWKKTFGFHPLLAYLDRPDVAGGEALAGILRPGKAGANTAADHIEILAMALAALPAHARPCPGDPAAPQVMVRTDAAGATHAFARAMRDAGCGFSIAAEVQAAVLADSQRVDDARISHASHDFLPLPRGTARPAAPWRHTSGLTTVCPESCRMDTICKLSPGCIRVTTFRERKARFCGRGPRHIGTGSCIQ